MIEDDGRSGMETPAYISFWCEKTSLTNDEFGDIIRKPGVQLRDYRIDLLIDKIERLR